MFIDIVDNERSKCIHVAQQIYKEKSTEPVVDCEVVWGVFREPINRQVLNVHRFRSPDMG